MPVLDAENLTKNLSTRTLLKQVNITIARGEKVGLVGNNGAGKSTLAKILAQVQEADQGSIRLRRGAKVAYLEQEPKFQGNPSAEDAALSGITEWLDAHSRHQDLCERLAKQDPTTDQAKALLHEQAELSAEVERLGGWNRRQEAIRVLKMLGIIDTEQRVETMSGGERRRVALAALLIARPDLAILDEPTNHLDAETIEWLEGYLSEEYPGALLVITHDRWLLNQVVDRTLEIEDGAVYSYKGGWETFLMGRDERIERERKAEANRQNFLRTEIEWLRRQPKARTGKQKARMDRAQTALSQAPQQKTQALRLDLKEQRLGSTILETKDLVVEFPGRRLVDGLTFQLLKGSRVGIVGPSGAGKTTLLRTLLGQLEPKSGEITVGKNTNFAYLDQMRSQLDDDETVYDAITGGRPHVQVGEVEYSSYSYLERFGFRGEALRQKVVGLSGGERARVALARLLLSPANVLVLDEPTNDLDVMTLAALEDLILGLSGAALLVSHDRYFLDRVATSVLVLDGQGDVAYLPGGYYAYSEYRREKEREKKEENRTSAKSSPSGGAKKKLTYAEELELGQLMPQIEQLGHRIALLEGKLADPSLHVNRREEATRLDRELGEQRSALEELEMRWLHLEEKKQGTN